MNVRFREDVGVEGQCEGCRDWWPLEMEFWYLDRTLRLCRACAQEQRRVRELRKRMQEFAPRPICGAWMPYAKSVCARRPRHRFEHRSRYALDNDREATRRERVA